MFYATFPGLVEYSFSISSSLSLLLHSIPVCSLCVVWLSLCRANFLLKETLPIKIIIFGPLVRMCELVGSFVASYYIHSLIYNIWQVEKTQLTTNDSTNHKLFRISCWYMHGYARTKFLGLWTSFMTFYPADDFFHSSCSSKCAFDILYILYFFTKKYKFYFSDFLKHNFLKEYCNS